jgi:hypothetical protein
MVHTRIFNYGEYAPGTGLSCLQHIMLSDASGTSVLPLTFGSMATVFDEGVSLNSILENASDVWIIPIDVHGSGRTELVIASKQFINHRYVLDLNRVVHSSHF